MTLAAALSAATGRRVAARPEAAVGGGSINECWRWSSREGPLFVKLAPGDRLWMFEAEAEGLDELGRADALRVPRVLGSGVAAGQAFLALEWIDFGSASSRSETLLGEGLAAQHRVTAAQFGWHRGNTIGSTPQHNDPGSRLGSLLRRAPAALPARSGRPQRTRGPPDGARCAAVRAGERFLRLVSSGPVAAARRPLGRQLVGGCVRQAGDLRSRGLLRRPRGRPRDDAAVRRLRRGVLLGVRKRVAARARRGRAHARCTTCTTCSIT